MKIMTAGVGVQLRVAQMAIGRQRRREQAGHGNFGTADASVLDHWIGLLGEWSVVRLVWPERLREWALAAERDIAGDSDVFGISVRTRNSLSFDYWVNARDIEKERGRWHALVTMDGGKERLMGYGARSVSIDDVLTRLKREDTMSPLNLHVHGAAWGAEVCSREFFHEANGRFPNRDSFIPPKRLFKVDRLLDLNPDESKAATGPTYQLEIEVS